MFTTSAQTLQLNQCYLEVHGIKYAPEVRTELMQLHRRGNFVNKTSVYQHQIYNIGSSLSIYSEADTQFQTILTSLQGEATSIMFWIRPSSQGGSTDSDIGHLNLNNNNNNILTLTSGGTADNGPNSLVVFVKTTASLTEDSSGNVSLSCE